MASPQDQSIRNQSVDQSSRGTTADRTNTTAQADIDATMASITQQMEGLQLTYERLQQQRGDQPFPTRSEDGAPRARAGIIKPKNFGNLPAENFLAWKTQFQVICSFNRWTQEEAKEAAFAHMVGTALESVMDIDIKGPLRSLKQVLDDYQNRFLPKASSQMLRAQFHNVIQLPTESVQKLHSRLRVLYHLAFPNTEDRSELTLVEKFIAALNNREVQRNVRRRKPGNYSEVLEMAQEETAFVLIERHSPARRPTTTDPWRQQFHRGLTRKDPLPGLTTWLNHGPAMFLL